MSGNREYARVPLNVPLTIRISEKQWNILAALAEKEQINPSAMVRALISREGAKVLVVQRRADGL